MVALPHSFPHSRFLSFFHSADRRIPMLFRMLIALSAMAGLLCLGWYFYPRGQTLEDHVGMDSLWHPNAEEIARDVGPGPAGTFQDERHTKFCALFKQRYRDHVHHDALAIGVKFIS